LRHSVVDYIMIIIIKDMREFYGVGADWHVGAVAQRIDGQ